MDAYERKKVDALINYAITSAELVKKQAELAADIIFTAHELKGYIEGSNISAKPPNDFYINLSDTPSSIELDWDKRGIKNIDNLIKKKDESKTLAFLNFTEQEILKMPKQFRKEFRTDGCTARITKRKSGKNSYCYEVRYRRNGYDVQASSTDLQTAKDKFIEKLKSAVKTSEIKEPKTPTMLHEFIMFYFENYRLGKIAQKTYKGSVRLYEIYIQELLGKLSIKDITPSHCKKVLDKILESEKGRTLEDVRSLLNQVFKMAIAHGLISRNPLAILVYDKHERESGTPLSKVNERLLIQALKGTIFQLPFAILLYTGVRPNELYTTVLNGAFIEANNSKRKRNQKKEMKRIAISPMLKPYITEPFKASDFPNTRKMREELKKTLPQHTLKDCRATFSTRSQECGVDKTVIKIFMGHSLTDMLGKHYTEFSDEFLISEAQKINY